MRMTPKQYEDLKVEIKITKRAIEAAEADGDYREAERLTRELMELEGQRVDHINGF